MSARLSGLARLFMLGCCSSPPPARRWRSRSCATAKPSCCSRNVSDPLIQAAGLDPKSVKVVLVNDPEINAFVAQGQVVYIHCGLLTAADNVNQLQGVIAHELGHVAGGHAIRIYDGARQGDRHHHPHPGAWRRGDCGRAPVTPAWASSRPASRPRWASFLAFTRAQESSADLAGASYLSKAGISGKGSIQFFKKLQNQEYRLAIYAKDSYDRTHPLSSERIAVAGARSTRRTRPGTARPTRRSRPASSGSRPS